MNINKKNNFLKNFYPYLIITLVVFIALFNSATPNILVQDDYALFFESILNRNDNAIRKSFINPVYYTFIKYFLLIDESIPRFFILLISIFTSIALFILGNNIAFKSKMIALIFAISISINPNQTLLPISMMGSYFIYAIFFFIMSLFFVYKAKIAEKKKNLFLIGSIIFFYLSIESIAIPSLLPLYIFALWQLFYVENKIGNSKNFIVFSLSSIILTTAKTVQILNHSGESSKVNNITSQERIDRFLNAVEWSNVFNLDKYQAYIFAFLLVLSLILLLVRSLLKHQLNANIKSILGLFKISKRNDFSLILFGVLWCFCLFLPFLFSKYYMVRYTYPFSIGYIFLCFLVIDRILSNLNANSLSTFIISSTIILAISWIRITNISNRYGSYIKTTSLISNELSKFNFPLNSQIILHGKTHEVSTGGYWKWSSGFLKYATNRADINGIVAGPDLKNYQILDTKKRGYDYKMSGIDTLNPIFIIEISNLNQAIRKEYLLNINNPSEDPEIQSWDLIMLDTLSGSIDSTFSGSSFQNLRKEIRKLKISSNRIYGFQDNDNLKNHGKIIKVNKLDSYNYNVLIPSDINYFQHGLLYSQEEINSNIQDFAEIKIIDTVSLIKNGTFDKDIASWSCWSKNKSCKINYDNKKNAIVVSNSSDKSNDEALFISQSTLPDSISLSQNLLLTCRLNCSQKCSINVYLRENSKPYKVARKFNIQCDADSTQNFIKSFYLDKYYKQLRLDFGVSNEDGVVYFDDIDLRYLYDYNN